MVISIVLFLVFNFTFLTNSAFDHIFETIAVSDRTKYLVQASYLEIYNEEIRDLLAKDTKAKLELKEHPEFGVYVAGLTKHKMNNVRECKVNS
ncbi:unnamed protein product [Protopolystoma xenopodis]|uniref:Kinesin motor domain-containing protein n=1 Tax=Protopolystoma xenopodis TaxID=117903 RepID=A0A3S4ZYX4_9PLAT|nr:unnamed protein product [Protopolystoma xenopodis]